MADSGHVIDVRNVRKSFRAIRALDVVSVEFHSGTLLSKRGAPLRPLRDDRRSDLHRYAYRSSLYTSTTGASVVSARGEAPAASM